MKWDNGVRVSPDPAPVHLEPAFVCKNPEPLKTAIESSRELGIGCRGEILSGLRVALCPRQGILLVE